MSQISLRPPVTMTELQAARDLCWDYRAFLIDHTADRPGLVQSFYPEDRYAAMLSRLGEDHMPPDGYLLLALDDGQAVGCGMFRRFDSRSCEWKRIYIAPEARGMGLGRRICDRLLAESRAAGYRRILLDTLATLEPATRLYPAMGFLEREPYYEVPPQAQGAMRFYERDLRPVR